ncbi:alpha-crystallin B chain-like [Daphnia pulicaria]|uniref:alpha-crystallin B chain-like n=1 Tax=Daphnia pulicaria TaxID=35523 RepID=UPI001EEC0A92|nr:alpha-crystallin B chain-like [Daphnia pulicaria]
MRWLKEGSIFKLEVNVAPFGSTGIKVFMTHGGDLIVHAGHDEQMENDGHISRRFEGRIAIPMGVDANSIESSLSPDGILTIVAKETANKYERIIPVFPADPHRHLSDHPHVSPGGP